jgi:hypothetical protein
MGGNPTDKHGPLFRLGADGRPVRAGHFDTNGGFSWRQFIGLNASTGTEEADLTAALIIEGARELERQYPGLHFHVHSWKTDRNFPTEVMDRTEHSMSAAGFDVRSMAEAVPRFPEVWPEYVIDPSLEWHPSPRGSHTSSSQQSLGTGLSADNRRSYRCRT